MSTKHPGDRTSNDIQTKASIYYDSRRRTWNLLLFSNNAQNRENSSFRSNGTWFLSVPVEGEWGSHFEICNQSEANSSVPIPATALLSGIGLIGLAGLRKKLGNLF